MKLICLALATFTVGAVPLSKASHTEKSDCCIVDPSAPVADPDSCRCFGAYEPAKEHQQCMSAAPQYTNEQLKRSWQAGCWCIDETKTCQDFCEYTNTDTIRVLNVDWATGQNSWDTTSVDKCVAQPPNLQGKDARMECYGACVSRGFCSAALTKPWEDMVAGPACGMLNPDSDQVNYMFDGGDDACKDKAELTFGQSCSVHAKDGDYWCRTNTIECGMDKSNKNDPMAVSYNVADWVDICPKITLAPTKEPTLEPTMQPTKDPTAKPTQQPTFQPVGGPTKAGCPAHDSLPEDCNGDSLCGYLNGKCKACSTWDGNKDACPLTSTCGLQQGVLGQCVRCDDANVDKTKCEGMNGCDWDGSACV